MMVKIILYIMTQWMFQPKSVVFPAWCLCPPNKSAFLADFPDKLKWTILAKRILSGHHMVVSVSSWGYPQSSSISIWNSMITDHSWATPMDGNTPHEMSNHYVMLMYMKVGQDEYDLTLSPLPVNPTRPLKKCSTHRFKSPHVAQCGPSFQIPLNLWWTSQVIFFMVSLQSTHDLQLESL